MQDPLPRNVGNGTFDLSSPPNEREEPLASTSNLATSIDTYSSDITSFLNDLIAPLLPPSVPASNPIPVQPDLNLLDKSLNDLLTRLTLLSQDTASSLEQSIHDISRTVPRLTYDLQFMRESAASLQTSLHSVQQRVARQTNIQNSSQESDEVKTHKSLEKLAYLDKVKTRMESARDVLREAESWSTLESEITSFIASQSWTKAGERLAEASKSMVVFQNTPTEYETRKGLLVSLQNELETALSAALKDALEKSDTEACAKFYDIFEMMERGQEFRNYYFASRRASILSEWNDVVLLDASQVSVEESSTPTKFTAFLPRFYSTLLTTLTTERTQVPLIFSHETAADILSTFVQTTLDALQPSMQSRLSALADFYGSEALPEVIRAFNSTEDLGTAIQSVMDKVAFNTQGGIVSGSAVSDIVSPGVPDTRRLTKKISRRFSRAPGSFSESPSSPSIWETTLYEPFLDLQASYPNLERKYLVYQLKHDAAFTSSSTSSKQPKDDAAKLLWERAVTVFGMADDAIGRCTALTHGYGAEGLIQALNHFFTSFLETHQKVVLDIAKKASGGEGLAPDELDFDGLDYSTEDWGSFQLGLHILETCRDIRERLAVFEGKLHTTLVGMSTILQHSSDPSLHNTTQGALSLLQQSPLNSADLHAIINSISTNPAPTYTLSSAQEALKAFTHSSQLYLQEIILSPLRGQLNTYPSLSVWNQPDKAPRKGELQIPSFSLSPTDVIARVSEGLLNLLRVFEVYAQDDALAFSIETLPFVDVDSLKQLLHPVKSSEATSPITPTPAGSLNAETVLSTWVSSLSLSLLSDLTSSTLPSIRALSTHGAAQLASDLGYLSNAVRALDVEWEELERWREASEVKDLEELRALIGTLGGDDGDGRKGREIMERVGRLRGWGI